MSHFCLDIGRGLGPLWVSLIIEGTGGRVPGFNYSLAGWFVCALLLFIMSFTVLGDLRKLDAATKAAMERRMQGQGIVTEAEAVDLENPKVEDVKPAIVLGSDVQLADSSDSHKLEHIKPASVLFAAYASESESGEHPESELEDRPDSSKPAEDAPITVEVSVEVSVEQPRDTQTED
jgi:hypothetical protein